MKGSLIVAGCFAGGFIAGRLAEYSPEWLHTASLWLLYLLMLQVGLGIGSDPKVKEMLRTLTPVSLLLPLTTVAGALILTYPVAFMLKAVCVTDSLAINSVCGYYSLSSIMLSQLKEPLVGATLAAKIGAVALLANVVRELIALTGAPLIARHCGKEAVIAAAGVTSVDVCLPAIRRWCGERYVGLALVHGTVIDVASPFMLTLFASL
ncbi:MAG: lysine exporter LysO family protein [Paramuribaculum sp.]|nr:lysine exporter LysO family protein [Paramuribaculum sp.]